MTVKIIDDMATESLENLDGFDATLSEEAHLVTAEEADAEMALGVCESLDSVSTDKGIPKSALLMATSIIQTNGPVTALEGVTAEDFNADVALEGIGRAVVDKIKSSINAIAKMVLKPVNAMLDLGGRISRWNLDNSLFAKLTGKPADEAMFGKKVDPRTATWIIGGVSTAMAIGLLFAYRVPQISSLLAKSFRAAGEGLTPEKFKQISAFDRFVLKISEFKWPFGEFTASVKEAGTSGFGQVAVKLKRIDALKSAKAAGKKLNISEFKLFASKAKAMGSGIIKAAQKIAGVVKEFVVSSAKLFDMVVSSAAAEFTHTYVGASGVAKVAYYAAKACIYSLFAVISGFVGKVVLEGTHFVMSILESWTSDAKRAA